jgi:hypothetical protein
MMNARMAGLPAATTRYGTPPGARADAYIGERATPIATSNERDRPRDGATWHDVRSLLKVRAVHAFVIALLITAHYFFLLLPRVSDKPDVLAGMLFVGVGDAFLFSMGTLALITLLQATIAPGRVRWLVLLSSVAIWAVASVLWSTFGPWQSGQFWFDYFSLKPVGVAWHLSWTLTTYGLLAAWYYESADSAARMTAALRQSELARRGAERWVLELRLTILQARVDPRVLFDALDEAGRLYRSSGAAAERLLDDLIDYLRQALPKLRQAESTLAQEVDLARAYARVLRGTEQRRLDVLATVEPAIGDARFPPMVLQPLCDALVRRTLDAGRSARLTIAAVGEAECVRLSLSIEPGHGPVAIERMDDARRTLNAMFGPLARIEVTDPASGKAGLFVEVPYVAAARTDC